MSQHYAMKITPITYILENNLDFCTGNIIKYASRWNKKGPFGALIEVTQYCHLLL